MWLPATEFGGPARIVARSRSGMDVRRCGQRCCASGSSLCTIASGGSIGREGAMVHWPQRPVPGLGSWAASRATNYASLLACGAAAGFASAYDAALSGAIFIAELVYGTLVIRRQFPTCIVG